MILTNKQAIILFQILSESLRLSGSPGMPFLHTQEFRMDLYHEIKEQQSNTLIDLEKMDEL